MAHTPSKSKGRSNTARYLGVNFYVLDSDAFTSLKPWIRALFFDLRRQYYGSNNGDISAADSILGPLGWSHSTIHKGLKVLIDHGLLEQTRQGGIGAMNRICSLYAFTDLSIADFPAKRIKGRQPSHAYRDFKAPKESPPKRRKVSDKRRQQYAELQQQRRGSPRKPASSRPEPRKVQQVTQERNFGSSDEPCCKSADGLESRADAGVPGISPPLVVG